jgi:hypothetical protein
MYFLDGGNERGAIENVALDYLRVRSDSITEHVRSAR